MADMMGHSWRSFAAATIGLLIAGTNAQTVGDLGTLLAGQKNLTTFYGLIQVCRVVLVARSNGQDLEC